LIPFSASKSKPSVPSSSEMSELDIEVVVDLADLEGDELELTDDDFELLDAAPPPTPPVSRSFPGAALGGAPSASPPNPRRPISQTRLDTLRTRTLREVLPVESQPPPPPRLSEPDMVREPRRSFSRPTLDEDAEASVADECLATIAAAASHARASDPLLPGAPSSAQLLRPRDEVDALIEDVSLVGQDVSFVGKLPPPSGPPRSLASMTIPPPSSSSAAVVLPARLPPMSPPPFMRAPSPPSRISVPGVVREVSSDDDAAETLPFPMKAPFARTTTDDERASRPSFLPDVVASATLAPSARSVAPPIPAPRKEPSVTVVVRERPPRIGWVIAAAAIGALAAVTVMRIAAPAPPTAAPAPALASATAPPAQAEAQAAAVVRFGEDEGVSINAPASAVSPISAPAPAPAPPPAAASHAARSVPAPAQHASPARAPAGRPRRQLDPKVAPPVLMPDGSLGLANTGKATTPSSASTPAPAPTPLPLPPSGGRKRPLTPEQELAEAQLRAAVMR